MTNRVSGSYRTRKGSDGDRYERVDHPLEARVEVTPKDEEELR